MEFEPMEAPPKAEQALAEKEAKRLILTLDGEQQAIEAAMFGAGIEWQACERLMNTPEVDGGDINRKDRAIFAHGTKTKRYGSFRNRWVEVTEAWCWDILVAWLDRVPDGAPMFSTSNRTACDRHVAASKALTPPLRATTLHQLGHSPRSVILDTTYSVQQGAAKLTADQERRRGLRLEPVVPATDLATGPRNKVRRRA